MTKMKKYVRIKKAPNKSSWYANKIGQVFEVDREGYTYLIRKGPHHLTAVRQEDAELIVTENRPAEVGERVLITEKPVRKDYEIYEPVTVDNVNIYGVESYKNGRPIFLNHYEYEVIVNNEVKNEEADGMKIDLNAMGYDELIAHGEEVMRMIRLRSYGEGYKQGKFDAGMDATYMRPQEKTAQERRDEIVEQAKADIEGLKTDYSYAVPDSNDPDHPHFCFAEFIVDNEKRTIVALLRGNISCRVYARGIAKAAPDDCFNVHIGMSIALHRALGLEVPNEYLNAPQPTEVRVGDVVLVDSMKNIQELKVVDDGEYIGTGEYKAALTSIAVTKNLIRIIDDSRTEVCE
ncbi:hypothetical protein P9D51_11275 [Bacillus sonorensis]|uniref:hypothetical protein n=1 Tax=Bacillus sonorensis TaxID=119858 RepID=UPI002DBD7241|nr:hypothetical protein [Bacillus sonorensis]MEC1426686.1 hypothetical protein [Bacillus sonorensis]